MLELVCCQNGCSFGCVYCQRFLYLLLAHYFLILIIFDFALVLCAFARQPFDAIYGQLSQYLTLYLRASNHSHFYADLAQ